MVCLLQYLQATIGNLTFDVIDTGGLDDKGDFGPEMLPHTNAVLSDADVVLFLIDARLGVTPEDEHFAKYVNVMCERGSSLFSEECCRAEGAALFQKVVSAVSV